MTERQRFSVAIVGATGAVGRELLDVLASRRFPMHSLRLLASARSAGTVIEIDSATAALLDNDGAKQPLVVEELSAKAFDGVDVAFFCASGNISSQWVETATAAGAIVIDNSKAFRMDPNVPLIVPEVNGETLLPAASKTQPRLPRVVANPNCSTIIALLAIAPLHRAVGISRMVVSTYQAASGGGAAMMTELEDQARQFAAGQPLTTNVLDRPYLFNVFSHNSPIGVDGNNEEEAKLIRETHKILSDDSIGISATCVRVPVLRAHCESINLTLKAPLSENEARELLRRAPGVSIVDDRPNNRFPEPVNASGLDDVLIGRIRSDASQPEGLGLNLYVAGDQLRKGAALNAVQIAELIATTSAVQQPSLNPC